MTSKITKVNYSSLGQDGGRNTLGCPGLDVAQIALADPILALALIQSPSKQPLIYTLRAQLTTGVVDEQIDASAGDENGFCSDFLILGMRYQIRRINSFAASIFQGQANVNNALNSGIDLTLQVLGRCPNFFIVDTPTPIELVADPPGTPDCGVGFPYGFVAPKCGRIKANFTNRAPFVGSGQQGDTGPVEIFMAFRGISLGCGLQTIELPWAIEELDRLGIATRRVIVNG